jgi:hypothetical protein
MAAAIFTLKISLPTDSRPTAEEQHSINSHQYSYAKLLRMVVFECTDPCVNPIIGGRVQEDPVGLSPGYFCPTL